MKKTTGTTDYADFADVANMLKLAICVIGVICGCFFLAVPPASEFSSGLPNGQPQAFAVRKTTGTTDYADFADAANTL
jgi:hypothetical protein